MVAFGGRIGLEQLIGFNEEIAGLVRAGVPLELGLRESGQTIPGTLGRLTLRISERMSSGASLLQALEQEGDHLPPIYRSVVQAGLRAGRLPEALETLTLTARSLQDLHQRITKAIVYPLLVAIVSWLLLVAFIHWVVPEYAATWSSLRLDKSWLLDFLLKMRNTLPVWGAGIPALLFVILLGTTMIQTGEVRRPINRLFSRQGLILAWCPWVIRNYSLAVFARLLSLLLKHETPLPEAILLAAHASGNPRTIRSAEVMAEAARHGAKPEEIAAQAASIPEFLKWIIRTDGRSDRLGQSMGLASDVYYGRAWQQAEYVRVLLPVLLTLCVSGLITLLYSLFLFGPAIALYYRAGMEPVL